MWAGTRTGDSAGTRALLPRGRAHAGDADCASKKGNPGEGRGRHLRACQSLPISFIASGLE